MDVGQANAIDVDELVELRVAYLTEDNGELGGDDEAAIRDGLPGYYEAHLGRDLHAYVIRESGRIASCAFLIVVEKPMSPAFSSGRTGIVPNVYTRNDCRRKGYAKTTWPCSVKRISRASSHRFILFFQRLPDHSGIASVSKPRSARMLS